MLIAPVIFCTIVLSIGAIRQGAKVGRIAVWRWATSC
jgi:aerobic C4-dicarboxylate transport protein